MRRSGQAGAKNFGNRVRVAGFQAHHALHTAPQTFSMQTTTSNPITFLPPHIVCEHGARRSECGLCGSQRADVTLKCRRCGVEVIRKLNLPAGVNPPTEFQCANCVYEPANCAHCGVQFPKLSGKEILYCSDRCSRHIHAAKARARYEKRALRLKCEWCQEEFAPKYGTKKQKFCSRVCCGKFSARYGAIKCVKRKKEVATNGADPHCEASDVRD